jgi:hypothetical protein
MKVAENFVDFNLAIGKAMPKDKKANIVVA